MIKCLVTFPSDLCGVIGKQVDWFPKLEELFKSTNSFLRMSELIKWPCVFGCVDCSDEIRHYMQCPILWQLAREALSASEQYFTLGHRLCFIDCSVDKLRLLAYAHLLYHSIKNDGDCVHSSGLIKSSQYIQQKSTNLVKALKPLV